VLLLGAHVDVTPIRTTELALAESDARLRLAQEAVGIGAWEWSRAARRLLLSRPMLELWGFDPAAPPPEAGVVLARLHPADRREVRRALVWALRSGQFNAEFRILRPNPDGEAETVWIRARARLLADSGIAGDRMMGVAYDVSERKRAEAQAALLAHEVEHRAKNALTVVSALVRMSVARNHQEFLEIVQGRIMALARATTLLGQQRWQGADMRALIEHEMAPFQATGQGPARIALHGPPIMLTAEQAQPLCMALHELATNAAKYGALSVPEGRLDLRWWQAEGQVHLEWRERGGPRLEGPPARRSFGSRLIQQTFTEQLSGRIEKAWDPDGLSCSIAFPLGRP
jgi:two-component sensor histidine kinase